MINKREKNRLYIAIMIIYCLFFTFDHWTTILLPFIQWELSKAATTRTRNIIFFNFLSNIITFTGGFFIAQFIDSFGCRSAALLVTVFASLYQVLVSFTNSFSSYILCQFLLFAHHLPMVVDATIGQMVGEDGDDKERAKLIINLLIPQSLAAALGPYLAIQIFILANIDFNTSTIVCGALHFILIVPIILLTIPSREENGNRVSYLPSIDSYKQMLSQANMRWLLLFLVLLLGPYSAFDQLLRIHLASLSFYNYGEMAKFSLLSGGVSLVANLFFLPNLQSRFGPQTLLKGSLVVLCISYLYLSQANDYNLLLIGMPFQILAICIAYGQISSQILGMVSRKDVGKAAALSRGAHHLARAVLPMITGYYVEVTQTKTICFVCLSITISTVILVHFFGSFMRTHAHTLPLRTQASKFQ